MPIASKLLYFQRRPSLAPPPEPDPEPPGPRRRPCRGSASSGRSRQRGSLSHHHKPVRPQATPGQELVPGYERDGTKFVGSAGNIIEYIGGMSSSSRLNRSVSDHGRLPDAVQQARERLLQRLNSVDLSGRRLKTLRSETIWAGVVTHPADLGVSTSADSILTSCFQSSVSIAACKVQESSAEPFSVADEHTPVTLCSELVPKLHETTCEGVNECESTTHSVECSICLERCRDADGLIQLSCRHVFHSACLERWLWCRSDCPYCRASVCLTSDE